MKLTLTKNKETIVDDDTPQSITRYKWHTAAGRYAARRKTVAKNNSKIVYLHREIVGAPEGMCVDHINGDTLDNRRSNLRICTHQQNMVNWNNVRGKSRYRGVSWSEERQRWIAQIQVNGKNKRIGRFKTEVEAAKAYDKQALTYFKEFARLNFKENK